MGRPRRGRKLRSRGPGWPHEIHACRKRIVDTCQHPAYTSAVIRTFRSKALSELWSGGRTAKIDAKMHVRILARLDRLDLAVTADEMNVPGFDFHKLRGFEPARYT